MFAKTSIYFIKKLKYVLPFQNKYPKMGPSANAEGPILIHLNSAKKQNQIPNLTLILKL